MEGGVGGGEWDVGVFVRWKQLPMQWKLVLIIQTSDLLFNESSHRVCALFDSESVDRRDMGTSQLPDMHSERYS